MYMKKQFRQVSMTARYTALFFAIIMLLAGSISFVLLRFTAERFQDYEFESTHSSLMMAANDLETQYEIFEDIANQIKATYSYRPYVLHQNAYRDIEMLEDFTYFRNFSPLLEKFFLLYPEQDAGRQKVYTSDGHISYFSIYAQSNKLAKADEIDVLFDQISNLKQQQILVVDDQALLLFPLRFISSERSGDKVVFGVILSLTLVEKRMVQIAPQLPQNLSIQLNGCLLTDKTFANVPTLDDNTTKYHTLCASSEKARVSVATAVAQNKWKLLFSTLSGTLIIGIALCMLVVSCIAITLARTIVKPLRRLIEQHTPQGERFRNEVAQLDALMSQMERESNNSMHLLRERLLLTVLRGYYSENLITRWGVLQIRFDKQLYCVMIINTASHIQEDVDALMREIEAMSGLHALMYAVHVPDDGHVAIIIGFDHPAQTETLYSQLQQIAEAYQTECFTGKICETPQLLPISYMEAITAYLRAKKWQTEDLTDMHIFATQLVTAAERCDEESMRLLCNQLMQQMGAVQPPRMLLNSLAVKLTTELSILANDRHLTLDAEQLNVLILLPSMDLLMQNACSLVKKSFIRQYEGTGSRAEENAQAIVEYVKQNAFDADFDLSRIAERFGLSNDYVSMMIKKVTGSAFKEYLTELRIVRAEKMLKENSTMTVNEVSEQVGYRKTSNFIKKFKEKYGCTPAQYR